MANQYHVLVLSLTLSYGADISNESISIMSKLTLMILKRIASYRFSE